MMINKAFVMFIAMAASISAYAEPIPHPLDYLSHAVGGAIVVEFAEPETLAGAVAWSGAIGVAKELTDRNFDTADAVSWIVGGVLYHEYKINISARESAIAFGYRIDF